MSAELKYELFEEELLAPLRGHALSDDESLVAALLLDATSAQPIGIKHIVKVMNSRPRGSSPTVREGADNALADARATAPKTRRRKANDRVVKDIIRTLRKEHEFPVLSRKFARPKETDEAGNVTAAAKPAGYWWGDSEAEMEEFVIAFRKQPMDELHTLSRIVKANYPKLFGQMGMDYTWCGNIDGEDVK